MINLLPREEKQWLRRDYSRRRSIVVGALALFLIGGALLVALSFAALLYPERAAKLLAETAAAAKLTSAEFKATDELLKNTTAAAKQLSGLSDEPSPTNLIGLILARRSAGLAITTLDYERESAVRVTVKLTGRAAGRADLIGFLNELKAEPRFTKIDSPLANLVHDTEPFSLTIEINTKSLAPKP